VSVLHLGVQGGASRNDTSRLIASNIAPNLQTATANYNGWYVSPELGYWLRYGLGTFAGATYTLTPNLRVRYLYGSFDGYRETGSAANLTVAGRDVQNVEERGEVRLMVQTGSVGGQMTRASVYGGVLGVQRVGDFTVNSILLGQPLPFATLGKGDVWGGFAGGEAEARFGSFALFAGGEWLALSGDSTIVSGKAGLRVSF
jgi:outer membrane autotransporter protein